MFFAHSANPSVDSSEVIFMLLNPYKSVLSLKINTACLGADRLNNIYKPLLIY